MVSQNKILRLSWCSTRLSLEDSFIDSVFKPYAACKQSAVYCTVNISVYPPRNGRRPHKSISKPLELSCDSWHILAKACCLIPAASVEDSGREYKTFRGLKAADLEPPEFKGKKGRSIHLFLGNNSLTSLSCRKNEDGTYSGTLALKNGGSSFSRIE